MNICIDIEIEKYFPMLGEDVWMPVRARVGLSRDGAEFDGDIEVLSGCTIDDVGYVGGVWVDVATLGLDQSFIWKLESELVECAADRACDD